MPPAIRPSASILEACRISASMRRRCSTSSCQAPIARRSPRAMRNAANDNPKSTSEDVTAAAPNKARFCEPLVANASEIDRIADRERIAAHLPASAHARRAIERRHESVVTDIARAYQAGAGIIGRERTVGDTIGVADQHRTVGPHETDRIARRSADVGEEFLDIARRERNGDDAVESVVGARSAASNAKCDMTVQSAFDGFTDMNAR